MLICPEASSAQNSTAAVSADGSTVLDPSLELFVQPLEGIGGAHAAPLARRQTREGEQAFSCLLQAVGDGAMLEPPFADEGFAARLERSGACANRFLCLWTVRWTGMPSQTEAMASEKQIAANRRT
jgi:hypothetical protein